MILGKTGVGKSTLCNILFGFNEAETGDGRPISKIITVREKKGYPFALYDTPGFELNEKQQTNLIKEIKTIIRDGYQSKDISKQIHCILYCINTAANKYEEKEIQFLKELTRVTNENQVPVIIVLTQSFSKKKAIDMKKELKKENLNVVDIIPVLAKDMEINDNYTVKAYGMDNLLKCLEAKLPKTLQTTLRNIRIAIYEIESLKVVKNTVIVNFGAASILPATIDYMALVTTDTIMLTKISQIFGFDIPDNTLRLILYSVIGSELNGYVEQKIFSLTKFIPVAGPIISSIIEGSTGAATTYLLGIAYINLMKSLYKEENISFNDFFSEKGIIKIQETFKKNFNENYDEKIKKIL